MATYSITPRGDVVLIFSKAEARGLDACAGEGAEGLLNDRHAASGYIGSPAAIAAARRALGALAQASAAANERT